jgi:hypothetical protein
MGTSGSTKAIRIILATVATALGLAFFAGPASAEPTVWLCKPGQADNPCTGTLAGVANLPPDSNVEPLPPYTTVPLDYSAADRPPVDCFYLYPTQSDQTTSNADLSKDAPIRGVAINQARMFSRICDVYAPMYRQYTFNPPAISDEVRDIAYNSALGAWRDYMQNYNNGRGVVIIGHSQGSSHMGRLIAEEIDPNPVLRKQLISAIIPGANVYVPKGEVVGGQFQNIPACESGDQIGCVIAYSMFDQQPNENSSYGWMDTGYWINPSPRPDKDQYEVLCVNPAELSGDAGVLSPLANLNAFLGLAEGKSPWLAMPQFYRAECRSAEETKGEVNWLNVEDITIPGDTRTDLTALPGIKGSGGNLHIADVNLALDNLVRVAASQSRAYVAAERQSVVRQRAVVRKRISATTRSARSLKSKAARAARVCRKNRRACARSKSLRRRAAQTSRRVSALRRTDRNLTARIDSLVGPEA